MELSNETEMRNLRSIQKKDNTNIIEVEWKKNTK